VDRSTRIAGSHGYHGSFGVKLPVHSDILNKIENRKSKIESDRWSTVDVRCRVLAVVRTLTSLDRLHDVFPVLADDVRIEMHFAVAAGSEFDDGLTEHLRSSHMRVVEWRDATKENFRLAISASNNGELHELDMPLITLPHGAGYHKYRPTEAGFAHEVSGLSREQLLHDGRVTASVLCLSHDNQLALLRSTCPEAADHARVVGDPCYDRLRASLPMREHYRRELGVGQRKLVVVSSTWGRQSLFGRQPDLALRLATELPADRYQVALVLHPNIWTRHSPWQIQQWTKRARANGLLLVPPHKGWRATLISADVVVSDHGSLAFYAATLGTPLLLAEFGTDEIATATPMAALGKLAPRLDPGAKLRPQVDAAMPLREAGSLAAEAFAWPDESAARLREVIYDQLGLAVPSWSARAEPVDLFTP
jgi:hypothetical protein